MKERDKDKCNSCDEEEGHRRKTGPVFSTLSHLDDGFNFFHIFPCSRLKVSLRFEETKCLVGPNFLMLHKNRNIKQNKWNKNKMITPFRSLEIYDFLACVLRNGSILKRGNNFAPSVFWQETRNEDLELSFIWALFFHNKVIFHSLFKPYFYFPQILHFVKSDGRGWNSFECTVSRPRADFGFTYLV